MWEQKVFENKKGVCYTGEGTKVLMITDGREKKESKRVEDTLYSL